MFINSPLVKSAKFVTFVIKLSANKLKTTIDDVNTEGQASDFGDFEEDDPRPPKKR